MDEIIRGGSIALRSPGLDLEPETVWDTLGLIAERYPELDRYSGNEDEKKFKVSYSDEKNDEKSFVVVSRDRITLGSSDDLSGEEWKQRYRDILSIILENIKISPLSVRHIDDQIVHNWETRIHHGRLLYELFGKGAGFDQIVLEEPIRLFSPGIVLILDKAKELVCNIGFASHSPSKADLFDVYPEPFELSAACGIAKSGNFQPRNDLMAIIENVADVAEDFFVNQFELGVETPITELIAQMEAAEV